MASGLDQYCVLYPAIVRTEPFGRDWLDRLKQSIQRASDLFMVADVIELLPTVLAINGSNNYLSIELLLNGQSIWKNFGRVTTNGKPLVCWFQVINSGGIRATYGPVEMRTLNRQYPGLWFDFADLLAYHLILCIKQKCLSTPFQRMATKIVSKHAAGTPMTYFPAALQFAQKLHMAFKRRLLPNPNAVQWGIGLFDAATVDSAGLLAAPRKVVWLNMPTDRFWADPMLAAQDGTLFLFYEEFIFNKGIGTLCVTELRGFTATVDCPAIDLEFEPEIKTHLSFPFVFQAQEHWFLIPENMQSGQTNLYRCQRFPDRWRMQATLLTNVAGVDPVIFFHADLFWLFVGDGALGAQDNHLRLFYSTAVDGTYNEHQHSPIKLGLRGSRMAGPIINEAGCLIRVAQDCSKIYGGSLVMFEINELSPTVYRETELHQLLPDIDSQFPLGLHSLYKQPGIHFGAIDGLRKRPPTQAS